MLTNLNRRFGKFENVAEKMRKNKLLLKKSLGFCYKQEILA